MTAATPKVAWFTPFGKNSSVGQFSQAVTQQLSAHALVDLWVAETTDLLETPLRVIPYTRISRYENWLGDYDYVAYNLGSKAEDYCHIYDASQRHRGVVILHDGAIPEPVLEEAVAGAMGVIAHSDLLCDRVRMVSSAPVNTIRMPGPDTYASQFLLFCGELAAYQPAFRLAELIASEFKAVGITPDMAIVDTVARQAASLLDGEWDPPILRKMRDKE